MKLRFLLLTSLLLLALFLGSIVWLQRLDDSLAGYRSPLRSELPVGRPTTPLVRQVVLVVVEDLTDDLLAQMPFLSDLRRQGVWAALRLPPYADVLSLLTGATPELIPRLKPGGVPDPSAKPAPEDLYSAVQRMGGSVVVAASPRWLAAAPGVLSEGYAPTETGPEGDAAIVRQVLRRLEYWFPELQVVTLSQMAASPTVTQALRLAQTVDAHLAALWQMAQARNPGNMILVVLGSQEGAPVVIAGKGILPGRRETMSPGDLTVGIATLLGAPLPNAAQGQPPFSWLKLDEPFLAEKQIALAQQRMALADAYLYSIRQGVTGESVESDLTVAASALSARSYSSAYRLAAQAFQQADREMAAGRSHRLDEERRLRLPILLLAVFPLLYALFSLLAALAARVPLLVVLHLSPQSLLRHWPPDTLVGATMAAIACGGYHLLAAAQAMSVEQSLLLALAWGQLGVWTASWWLRRGRDAEGRGSGGAGGRGDGGTGGCTFTLVFVYLLLLPLAWAYYWEGAWVTWYLPDAATLALLRQSLAQVSLTSFLALPVLWVAGLGHAVFRVGRWLARARPEK